MLKLYTAFTKEIDDPEAAAREICEQLKPQENMLKNTVGIITFYREFLDTGAYEAVRSALPFETIGGMTTFIGSNSQHGGFAMSVSMITSDDVRFSIHTLDRFDTKLREQILLESEQLCKKLCVEEVPKLVMAFTIPNRVFSADDFVASVNALPEPFPVFGAVSFDESKENVNVVTYGDIISPFMCAFVAFYGNVEPKFHVASAFSYDTAGETEEAEITSAEGPILKTVNGISALDYLRKQGLIDASDSMKNTWTVPAVLTCKNGTKIVRAFLGAVDGTDYAFSAGTIEEGMKIKFAALDGDKTLESAELLLNEIMKAGEKDVFSYSCAARSWSLGSQYSKEVEKFDNCSKIVENSSGVPLQYCVSCVGGEICPVRDKDGNLVNALHNYSLIACSLN